MTTRRRRRPAPRRHNPADDAPAPRATGSVVPWLVAAAGVAGLAYLVLRPREETVVGPVVPAYVPPVYTQLPTAPAPLADAARGGVPTTGVANAQTNLGGLAAQGGSLFQAEANLSGLSVAGPAVEVTEATVGDETPDDGTGLARATVIGGPRAVATPNYATRVT